MRRLLLIATSVVVLLALLAPVALAAGPVTSTGSVLVSVNGSLDVPAGTSVNTVVVVDGIATISGDADVVVIAGGTATITGASIDELVVVDGSASLGAGTTIGDLSTWQATVTQADGAAVLGRTTAFETDLVALAILLVPLAIALTVGLALFAFVAAMAVVAFGTRQLRMAEAEIDERPGHVLVAGLVGAFALPIVGVLLVVSVVGAPVGLGLLFGVLPVAGYLGWLVAATWIGEWILSRGRGTRDAGRPYRAAMLGVLVLAVASVIPFVSAIATMFGLGAMLLVAWRVLLPADPQAPGQATPPVTGPMAPAPTAG